MGCKSGKEKEDVSFAAIDSPLLQGACPELEDVRGYSSSDASFASADEGSCCSQWDEIDEVGSHSEEFMAAHIRDTSDLYGFNCSPASHAEQADVIALRQELRDDLAAAPAHPELLSDWKLLRFLRGHHKVELAAKAFRQMLAYRVERNVDTVREELLAGSVLSDGRLNVQHFTANKWPYLLPKFSELWHQGWDGCVPCVQHGSDRLGNVLVYVYFKNYNLDKIAKAGLGNMWVHMALHCDVYFDLLLHELTLQRGCMIGRHDVVDATDVGVTTMGTKGISLISRLGASAEHYPEMIIRTTAVNFGTMGLAVLQLVECRVTRAQEKDVVLHSLQQVAKDRDGTRRLGLAFETFADGAVVEFTFDNTSASWFSADVKFRVQWFGAIESMYTRMFKST